MVTRETIKLCEQLDLLCALRGDLPTKYIEKLVKDNAASSRLSVLQVMYFFVEQTVKGEPLPGEQVWNVVAIDHLTGFVPSLQWLYQAITMHGVRVSYSLKQRAWKRSVLTRCVVVDGWCYPLKGQLINYKIKKMKDSKHLQVGEGVRGKNC